MIRRHNQHMGKMLNDVLTDLMKSRRNQHIEKVNGLGAEINSYLMWIR